MNRRIVRAIQPDSAPLRIRVDGIEITAYAGDSLLVAVLTARNVLRRHEFNDEHRGGFCLMGACQDCWVWLADGERVRACTTLAAEGLHVLTGAPPEFPT